MEKQDKQAKALEFGAKTVIGRYVKNVAKLLYEYSEAKARLDKIEMTRIVDELLDFLYLLYLSEVQAYTANEYAEGEDYAG